MDESKTSKPFSLREWEQAFEPKLEKTLFLLLLAFVGGVTIFFGVVLFFYVTKSLSSSLSPTALSLKVLSLAHGFVTLFCLILVLFVIPRIFRMLLTQAESLNEEQMRQKILVEAIRGTVVLRLAVMEGAALFGCVVLLLATLSGALYTKPWLWLNAVSFVLLLVVAVRQLPLREKSRDFFQNVYVKQRGRILD